jgi:hypothetical protein
MPKKHGQKKPEIAAMRSGIGCSSASKSFETTWAVLSIDFCRVEVDEESAKGKLAMM